MSQEADPLRFGPFLNLPDDARALLAASSSTVGLLPGEVLIQAGGEGDACYALLEGMLLVELAGAHLRRHVSPPALVGEIAIVNDVPRTATVTADGPSALLRIPAAVFRAALDAHPQFTEAVRAQAAVLLADTFLRRDSPFAELPSDALDRLASCLVAVSFPAGASIITEGATDDDVYLIRSGRAEVVRAVDGSERRLATLGPGAFVGEAAALTGAPRTATVRALERVDAYRLAAADFRPLLREHAVLVERFGQALHARHRPRAVPHATALPCPDEADAMILRNDETGVYLKMSREARVIFADLDGERTLRDLVLRHFQRIGTMDPPGVFRTVATLQAAGFASTPQLIEVATGGHRWRSRLLDLVLAPRLEVRSADGGVAALHRLLWPLTTRAAATAALAVGIAGAIAFVLQFRELSINAFGIAGVVIAWAALLLAGLGHELAHALACKSYGSRLGRAGIGLMWFSPVIWVDTTDTWALDRRRRILVNTAGPLFNFALGGMAALLAGPAQGGASELLLWFAGMNYLAVAFNLSPLLEFDGYYALSDLTNTPMLRHRALRFVFRELLDRPRLPRGRSEWGLFAFAIGAVGYVAIVTMFVALAVPATVRTVLAGRLGTEWLLPVGIVAAAALALLSLGPLIDNVRAARRAADDLSAASAGSAP